MSRPIGIPAPVVTVLLGAAFVVSWSSGFVGPVWALEEAGATTLLLWRSLPAALLLTPFLLRHLARARREGRAATTRRHVLIGLLSQATYLGGVYGALALGVNSGTTSLMDGVQPLVVAALAGPLLGVAVGPRQWGALVVGAVGVGLVVAADASAGGSAPAAAYAVPLLGMAGLVAATFLERRTPAPVPPMERLAIHTTASTVVFAVVAAAAGGAVPPATPVFWWTIAWLAAVPTLAAYGLYWWLLERNGVTTVNALLFLVPPVTTVWAAIAFGEPVTALTVAGLALATGATWVVVRDDAAAPPAPTPVTPVDEPAASRPRCRA
jgi:drug/metabolite transporter (DMT)-like permease